MPLPLPTPARFTPLHTHAATHVRVLLRTTLHHLPLPNSTCAYHAHACRGIPVDTGLLRLDRHHTPHHAQTFCVDDDLTLCEPPRYLLPCRTLFYYAASTRGCTFCARTPSAHPNYPAQPSYPFTFYCRVAVFILPRHTCQLPYPLPPHLACLPLPHGLPAILPSHLSPLRLHTLRC